MYIYTHLSSILVPIYRGVPSSEFYWTYIFLSLAFPLTLVRYARDRSYRANEDDPTRWCPPVMFVDLQNPSCGWVYLP